MLNKKNGKKMQLRSGKILSSSTCFGTAWPTIKEAQYLSVATNDVNKFHEFCLKTIDSGCDTRTNRLACLVVTESLFRCGPDVREKYFMLFSYMHKKFEDSFWEQEIPGDMKMYLAKLKCQKI